MPYRASKTKPERQTPSETDAVDPGSVSELVRVLRLFFVGFCQAGPLGPLT